MKLGLHNAARYYYYPGWHEPGTTAEFGFNKKAYESLPADLRHIVDEACAAVQVYGLMDYDAKNAIALQKLRTDFKGKVEILQLSTDTLKELRKMTVEVLKEESEKTPQAKKVAASIAKFQSVIHDWSTLGEGSYQTQLAAPSA